MYLSSVLSLFATCLAMACLGCNPNVPPPNPISGAHLDGGTSDDPGDVQSSAPSQQGPESQLGLEAQPGEQKQAGNGPQGQEGRKGAKGPQPDGEGPKAPNWIKMAEVKLDGPMLKASVATTATCCGGAKNSYKRSPARFYLAADDEGLGKNGFLLWLDEKDQIVLSRMTEPQVYGEDVYRSKKPAKRADGQVFLECPTSVLPKAPTYIWAGSPGVSTVGGKTLDNGNPEEGIPAFLLVPKAKTPSEAKDNL